MNQVKKVLILTNDTELEQLPKSVKKISKWYDIEFTVCHVIDIEEQIFSNRIVYLPEVSENKGHHLSLGESVSVSETLIKKHQDILIDNGQKVLNKFINKLNKLDIDSNSVLLIGDPVTEIIKYAQKNHFNLILTGQSPRNKLSQFIWKSLGKKISKKTPCSIWIQ